MAEFPWPRDLEPTNDPRKLEALLRVAWPVLFVATERAVRFWSDSLRALPASDVPGQAVEGLRSLVPGLSSDKAAKSLAAWQARGGPLACVLARSPREEHWPRLREPELEAFLISATAQELKDRFEAWKLLVLLDVEPGQAFQAISRWSPLRDELPTGQWIPAELLEKVKPEATRGVLVMPDGTRVPADLAQRTLIVAVNQGLKIKAIKLWRQETGQGLKESKQAVEALMDGSLHPGLRAGLDGLPALSQKKKPRSRSRQRLDEAIDELIRDRPFYWVVLATALLRPDPRLPTMAVGVTEAGEIALFYSPKFVLHISRESCMAVLVHEINHVLFDHVGSVPEDRAQHRKAWTLACECTANEFVPYRLPGAPITLELLGLPPEESTRTRYQKLKGRPNLPGLLSDDVIESTLTEDPENASDIVEGAQGPRGEAPPYPTGVLMDAADLVGEEADRGVAEAIGREPGLGTQGLCEVLTPEGLEQLAWDELLKKMAAGIQLRYATRRYPNRRQPDQVGIIPGRRSRKSQPVVLAAVDTSGSMSSYELQQVSNELAGLTRRNTRVALVQCDTEIHEAIWIGRGFRMIEVKGRGGTDLRPPFTQPVLNRFKPDLLAYFTDGYGPAPAAAPPGVEVLWVLTGSNPAIPARFGKVVCMKPRHQRRRVKTGGDRGG